MTFLLAVTSPKSNWMVADHRISFLGHPPRDHASKLMSLETTDGLSLVGYSGLGMTATGTQPAQWMARALTGHNLPLEKSLAILSSAMNREFPHHLRGLPGSGQMHSIVVNSFVGDEPRIYLVEIAIADATRHLHRSVRTVFNSPTKDNLTPRFVCSGSGGFRLNQSDSWKKPTLLLLRMCNRGKISREAFARHLASLNASMSRVDASVGNRCTVVWRCPKSSKDGGGQLSFEDNRPLNETKPIEAIGHGMNIGAVINAFHRQMVQEMSKPQDTLRSRSIVDWFQNEEIDREIREIPDTPDETLR